MMTLLAPFHASLILYEDLIFKVNLKWWHHIIFIVLSLLTAIIFSIASAIGIFYLSFKKWYDGRQRHFTTCVFFLAILSIIIASMICLSIFIGSFVFSVKYTFTKFFIRDIIVFSIDEILCAPCYIFMMQDIINVNHRGGPGSIKGVFRLYFFEND